MNKQILVPDIGDFEKVEIIEVLVKPGDSVKKNDPLVTLESDKSSVEVPSTEEGVIEKINVKIGDKVSKGDLILSINSINGEEKTTIFERSGELEIDYFEGKADSASIRWINDCEYIVKKLNPKNMAEEKPIHMKILSTTGNSYTFEYNIVGQSRKSKGVAIKTD